MIDPILRRSLGWPVRSTAWLTRWRPILPLLAAELAVWLGFGALLPVMPFYFREHGVDLGMLGLVVAAWPAARLLTEPAFGWLADRTVRVPLMLAGLLLTAVTVALPLVLVSPIAFLVLRALAGLGAAAYDPAARGFVVDATPPERRGEAFGLYAAAQMGGFLLGPAVGGIAAAVIGDPAVVFAICAGAILVASAAVALWVREPAGGPGRTARTPVPPSAGIAGLPADEPIVSARGVEDASEEGSGRSGARPPSRLMNRLLIAAIALQLGSFYSGGTYEVVWALYLAHLGAGLGFIGLTFAIFGLPVLLLSPLAGRWVDRRGALPFLIAGSVSAAIAAILYTVIGEPIWFIPIGLLEGAGFALLNPALYTLAASGSPAGRASTAQGILGASGTVGTIVASATAGYLAAIDLRLPFWVFSVVIVACLMVALAVGSRSMSELVPSARLGLAARVEA